MQSAISVYADKKYDALRHKTRFIAKLSIRQALAYTFKGLAYMFKGPVYTFKGLAYKIYCGTTVFFRAWSGEIVWSFAQESLPLLP